MDKNGMVEVKINDTNGTWMDLSEEFFRFLQGCGYQLTREDFAHYWAEATNTQYQANDDSDWYADDTGGIGCGGGCTGCHTDINYDFSDVNLGTGDVTITLPEDKDTK